MKFRRIGWRLFQTSYHLPSHKRERTGSSYLLANMKPPWTVLESYTYSNCNIVPVSVLLILSVKVSTWSTCPACAYWMPRIPVCACATFPGLLCMCAYTYESPQDGTTLSLLWLHVCPSFTTHAWWRSHQELGPTWCRDTLALLGFDLWADTGKPASFQFQSLHYPRSSSLAWNAVVKFVKVFELLWVSHLLT